MDGISSVDRATPTITNRLDGDTLLFYCAQQMNDLNGDIDARLAQQKQMHDVKALLNDAKPVIRQDDKAVSQEERRQFLTNTAQAIQAMPPGPDRNALIEAFQKFRQHACYLNARPEFPDIDAYLKYHGVDADVDNAQKGDAVSGQNHLTPEDARSIQDALNGASDSIGKNADLDMISLQDLVSKRQMAIQSTTQIMAKINQAFETIGNNIK